MRFMVDVSVFLLCITHKNGRGDEINTNLTHNSFNPYKPYARGRSTRRYQILRLLLFLNISKKIPRKLVCNQSLWKIWFSSWIFSILRHEVSILMISELCDFPASWNIVINQKSIKVIQNKRTIISSQHAFWFRFIIACFSLFHAEQSLNFISLFFLLNVLI